MFTLPLYCNWSIHILVPETQPCDVHTVAPCSQNNTVYDIFKVSVHGGQAKDDLSYELSTSSQMEVARDLDCLSSYYFPFRYISTIRLHSRSTESLQFLKIVSCDSLILIFLEINYLKIQDCSLLQYGKSIILLITYICHAKTITDSCLSRLLLASFSNKPIFWKKFYRLSSPPERWWLPSSSKIFQRKIFLYECRNKIITASRFV